MFHFDKFELVLWNYLEKLFQIPNEVSTLGNIGNKRTVEYKKTSHYFSLSDTIK